MARWGREGARARGREGGAHRRVDAKAQGHATNRSPSGWHVADGTRARGHEGARARGHEGTDLRAHRHRARFFVMANRRRTSYYLENEISIHSKVFVIQFRILFLIHRRVFSNLA